MWLIDKVAEQRITEANQKGEFDNLPGSGKPVKLDDDSHVPESLRAGYRMLKNAGYLPPELQARKEISSLHQLLESVDAEDGETKKHLTKRLNYLVMKVNICHAGSAAFEGDYYQKLRHRMAYRGS
ncbi:DnaJ family domain-containing protein [Kaarinaea lacus]